MRDRNEPTPAATTPVSPPWRERRWLGDWLLARTARARNQVGSRTTEDRRPQRREAAPATGVAVLP